MCVPYTPPSAPRVLKSRYGVRRKIHVEGGISLMLILNIWRGWEVVGLFHFRRCFLRENVFGLVVGGVQEFEVEEFEGSRLLSCVTRRSSRCHRA